MLWKIYFWASLILNVMGIVILVSTYPLAPINIVSLAWTVIMLFAAYSFAYHKHTIKQKYWRVVLGMIAFLFMVSLFELFVLPKDFLVTTFPVLKSNVKTSAEASILGLIFVFPSIYATYKLSKLKL